MTDKEEVPVRNALIVAALAGIPLMILLVALHAPTIVIWVSTCFTLCSLSLRYCIGERRTRRKEQARL